MGPGGDRVIEDVKATLHDLSNDLTVLHATLVSLKRRHGGALPPAAAEMMADLEAACSRAMGRVHELHAKF